MPGLISLYREKEEIYFSTPRAELARLINRSSLKVLDVGCAAGELGKELLKLGKAEWVTGIELVPEKGEAAREFLNEVRIGDIEEMEFTWDEGYFDCLIFGDVLEHLNNPWLLLKRLRPFLASDGMAIASIPNIRHWPVLAGLLFHDDWQYAQSGVLDITHLRFFTRRTALQLFTGAGFSVEHIEPSFNGRRYSIPNRFTFGLLKGLLAQGWLIILRAG